MSKLVFEGLKVADFSWVGVGPMTMRFLADHGATVVRVETISRPDALRLSPPYKDNEPGIDRSHVWANFNTNKYGMSLNLSHPGARDVALRLVEWADVVAESFTPGTMKDWGLDYETISKIRPDIVMFSTCQQGQTGPYARYAGYGPLSTALAGFHNVTGWPDREPVGPFGAYTDFLCPPMAITAVLAALDYRRRTGQGQYLDLSQFDCSLHYLAPMILDYTVNGRILTRMGNRDSQACPHGVYPCAGDDKWIAIAVTNDAQWAGLCRVLGCEDWLSDANFATFLTRKANEELLDRLLAELTARWTAENLMEQLQAAGVPAGAVRTLGDLYRDPQLAHRGHHVEFNHTETGPTKYDGNAFRLSKTPSQARLAPPCLGEHTDKVLREFLGYGDEEVFELLTSGALD